MQLRKRMKIPFFSAPPIRSEKERRAVPGKGQNIENLAAFQRAHRMRQSHRNGLGVIILENITKSIICELPHGEEHTLRQIDFQRKETEIGGELPVEIAVEAVLEDSGQIIDFSPAEAVHGQGGEPADEIALIGREHLCAGGVGDLGVFRDLVARGESLGFAGGQDLRGVSVGWIERVYLFHGDPCEL